jgi:hypothetical protein
MQTAAPDKYTTLIFWLMALVLTGAAFGIRMRSAETVMRGDGTIRFGDYDTMRRLARLRALDQSDSYPVTEVKDGFPQGTISHWTKPFDWTLQVLDPLVAPFVSGAEPYEAAAVLAGPILGTLCVLLFLWFSTRLLGRFPGLLATAFYALQYPLLIMNAVGNGDHQNLQHVFLLAFGCLWLLEHAGRIGRFAPPLSGVALGLGIWVSTESMVVFLSWVAITGCLLVLGPRSDLPRRASTELGRGVALWITLAVGSLVEHATIFAVEWDKVSWFQMYPVAVFMLFLVLARVLPDIKGRGSVAAVAGLGIGLLGLWLLPGFGTTVAAQLAEFDDVNIWLQTCVNEFRSSFWDGTAYSVGEGVRRFTFLLPGVPVFLAAAFTARQYPWRARVTLLALATISLGLAAWEVKLGHLFAIWFPIVMILGGTALSDRFLPEGGVGRPMAATVFVGALLAGGFLGLPTGPGKTIEISQDGIAELCDFLDAQKGKLEGSVIAPWDISAAILYRSDWPIVASGYHRNIEGIKDAYRFYSAQPDEPVIADEILDRRRVRFVVTWYSRVFLQDAQTVLQSGRRFFVDEGGHRNFTDLAVNSLFWRLRYLKSVPGYRLRYNSKIRITLSSAQPEPLFQVYEVKR